VPIPCLAPNHHLNPFPVPRSPFPMADPYAWLTPALHTIHRAQWHRTVEAVAGKAGPVVEVGGQSVVNFASNDYLGLAGDGRLIAAAIAATTAYGTGSTGSRLTSGHRQLHRDLEQAIADLKQTEAAIVFSSGYLANLGAIAAVVGPRDGVMGDRYNHSSLKMGAKLSGATVYEFPHGDLTALTQLLQNHRHQYRRCLITTDSVFSMDGDLCAVPELLAIAAQYEAMVLIDEAHGTGVFGPRGAGVVEHFGCTGQSLIQVGTLSKALGSLGGYVAGSAELIDFLRNRAPSWIYTTGLSPADTAAAQEAIALLHSEPQRRAQLWHNVDTAKQILRPSFPLLPSGSPILCAQLHSPAQALDLAAQLRQGGIWVPAIRPPTVPTSRLRFSIMASHDANHFQQLKQVIGSLSPRAKGKEQC